MSEKVLYFKSWLASKYINLLGNKNHTFNSILIIKLDEIGDLVTALPVFYALHKRYPQAQQTLVCKSFNTVFFEHIDYVQCVTAFETVNKNQYDLIVDLRGNIETISYALNVKPKYRLDRGSIRLKNKFFGGQKNEIDTNLEVISPLTGANVDASNSIIVSHKNRETVTQYLSKHAVDKYIIIHLGARDAARRWPIARFSAIINYLNEVFELPCFLVGGPEDDELNQRCLSQVVSQINFNVVGEFNLLEYAALCEKASLFIGNESGPLHIAAAMNIPNIALFGPGVKAVFYPKNEQSIVHHYLLSKGHKQQTIENSTIFHITVEEVKKSINKLLK